MSGAEWARRIEHHIHDVTQQVTTVQCSTSWFSADSFEDTMRFERALQRSVVARASVRRLIRVVPQLLDDEMESSERRTVLRNHAHWMNTIAAWERFVPDGTVVRTHVLLRSCPYPDSLILGPGESVPERVIVRAVDEGADSTPLLAEDRLISVHGAVASLAI
jgi:hypothetical protein